MRLLFLSLLIVLINAEECEWTRSTDKTAISDQIKKAWYTCIFDHLQNKTIEAYKRSNRAIREGLSYDDLATGGWTPLQQAPDTRTKVTIERAELRKVYPKESSKELDMEGYFHMTWDDKRLTWSESDWKLDEIKPAAISKTRKMWFPIFEIKETTGKGVTQASELILPTIKSNGHVNASIYLDWNAKCRFNQASYPRDKAVCETVFKDTWSKQPGSNIDLEIADPNIRQYVHYDDRYGWELDGGSIEAKREGDKWTLIFKISVTRSLTAYGVQAIIPIVLATILAMLAPLFGPYKWQAFIKVIALVLQYLAVADFLSNHWAIRYSSTQPHILTFFEFTMILTMITLIITLILYSISRRPPSLPPPHALTLIADKTSGICCCAAATPDGQEKAAVDRGESGSKAGSALWDGVLGALNNIFFIFFFILYLIGMLVFLAA